MSFSSKCQKCVAIVREPNWSSAAAISFALLVPLILWIGGAASWTYLALALGFALILSAIVVFFNRELRRKTRSLADSETRYRELVANLPGAVFRATYDEEIKFIYISDAIAMLTGFRANDFTQGTPTFESIIHPEDKIQFTESALGSRRRFHVDFRILTKSGDCRWIHMRASHPSQSTSLIADSARTIDGFMIDVSEQKQMSELLTQQQSRMASAARLSAIGEMAGGIAHEINNPLAIINLRTHQLAKLADKGEPQPTEIRNLCLAIEGMTERISKIIKSLKTVARESEHDPFEKVPVKIIFDDVFELCMQRMQKHGISIDVDPKLERLELDCRRVQLSQVMINLLNNAFDAVVQQPQAQIGISGRELREDGKDLIEIAITDSGSGISPEMAHRIFQPFFTTKPLGQGIGLGLSISKGIVESHNGSIRVDTDTPGTRFVITLPKFQARNYH